MPSSVWVLLVLVFSFQLQAQETPPQVDIGRPHILLPDNFSQMPESRMNEAASPVSEDVLRAFPGVVVSRSGSEGQTSFVFIRGADSAGTLVLLDGFPLNDPSLNNGAFDFSNLSLDGIERVEVWKGPQSVLFGSGATGGVINLVSKRGEGPVRFSARAVGGSQGTAGAEAGVRGAHANWNYSLSAQKKHTDGISSADAAHGGTERDGSSSHAVSARVGWSPDTNTGFEWFTRWSERRADLDYSPSPLAPFYTYADDPNYRSRGRTLALALRATKIWAEDLESNLSLSRVTQDRSYRNDPDPVNPGWVEGSYAGDAIHFENRNRWHFLEGTELLFGPAAEFESANSAYTSDTYAAAFPAKSSALAGFLVRLQWDAEKNFLTAGARVDHHSLFGTQGSFEFAPGLHLTPSLDLFARASTAYSAPTLFELYDPVSGNQKLRPEQARNSEISLARYFGAHSNKIQISGYINQYRNLIQYQSLRFLNVGSAVVRGAELEAAHSFGGLSLQAGYTYLETRNDSTGQRLLRRPGNAVTARAAWAPADKKYGVAVEYTSAGHRDDIDPLSGARVTAAGYQVWNATADWQATESLKLRVSAVNLTDLKYDEVAGYGREPRSYYLSATYAP